MNELNSSEHWIVLKEVISESILGPSQRRRSKNWITDETWNETNLRKATKQKINSADDTTKPPLLAEYSEINKRVKRYARRHKRASADKLAH